MSPSIWQILIVVAIFAILFMGPKRIPGLGQSLGEAIRGFKKGISGEKDEIDITDSSERSEIDQSERNADQSSQSAESKHREAESHHS